MSHRAVAVSLVVVGLLAALVASARLNPVYQSRALVSLGVITPHGPDSPAQQLALARDRTVRTAVEARHRSTGSVRVGIVDGGALEFRARSPEPDAAADLANAYAEAYVELRRQQLEVRGVTGESPRLQRLRGSPYAAVPQVIAPAVPARSPLPPWPSETWTLAGMVLLALALAVPGPEPGGRERL